MADFPQRIKQEKYVKQINNALAEKLNQEGHFPKLVIVDENMNIKTIINYEETFDTAYKKLEASIKK